MSSENVPPICPSSPSPPSPPVAPPNDELEAIADTGWLGRHITWLRSLTCQDSEFLIRFLATALICCEIAVSIMTIVGVYFLYKGIQEWELQKKIEASIFPPISALPPNTIEIIAEYLSADDQRRFALAGASRKTPNIRAGICSERRTRLLALSTDQEIQSLYLLVFGTLLASPDVLSQKNDTEILTALKKLQRKMTTHWESLPPPVQRLVSDSTPEVFISTPQKCKQFLRISLAVSIEFLRCAIENMPLVAPLPLLPIIANEEEFLKIQDLQQEARMRWQSLPESVHTLIKTLNSRSPEQFKKLIASARAADVEVFREKNRRSGGWRLGGHLFRSFQTKEELLEQGEAYLREYAGNAHQPFPLKALLIVWAQHKV